MMLGKLPGLNCSRKLRTTVPKQKGNLVCVSENRTTSFLPVSFLPQRKEIWGSKTYSYKILILKKQLDLEIWFLVFIIKHILVGFTFEYYVFVPSTWNIFPQGPAGFSPKQSFYTEQMLCHDCGGAVLISKFYGFIKQERVNYQSESTVPSSHCLQ